MVEVRAVILTRLGARKAPCGTGDHWLKLPHNGHAILLRITVLTRRLLDKTEPLEPPLHKEGCGW